MGAGLDRQALLRRARSELPAASLRAAAAGANDTVRRAQQALNAAGYNVGVPDGRSGPMTVAALRDFRPIGVCRSPENSMTPHLPRWGSKGLVSMIPQRP